MTAQQPDLFTGASLKADGIERVTAHNTDWITLAMAEISRLATTQFHLTADDLRPFINQHGQPHHPNAIGAAFSAAAKAGWIRRESFRKSTTISNHARYITVWKSNLV